MPALTQGWGELSSLPTQTLAHFLPSLSRIPLALQQPYSNQVAPGPIFLTSPFLFQV